MRSRSKPWCRSDRRLSAAGYASNSPYQEKQMTNSTAERIKGVIASSDVVLFMKGVPAAPQCGFSAAVVQILSSLAVPFKSVDVLSDPQIREGIKTFSNWPTIPQLYVKGEFLGGSDIIREMFQAGELTALLSDKGIATAAT
jgi:monothiol glutaredoxin